jgi:phage shock protein C
MNQFLLQEPWTRSANGWIAGVCEGIANKLDLNVGVIRLIWFLSVWFAGVGLLLYFVCAFSLPVEGKVEQSQRPKILGVCWRLSQRLGVDVGLLRIVMVLIALGSVGTTILAYIVVHFLLPEEPGHTRTQSYPTEPNQ